MIRDRSEAVNVADSARLGRLARRSAGQLAGKALARDRALQGVRVLPERVSPQKRAKKGRRPGRTQSAGPLPRVVSAVCGETVPDRRGSASPQPVARVNPVDRGAPHPYDDTSGRVETSRPPDDYSGGWRRQMPMDAVGTLWETENGNGA